MSETRGKTVEQGSEKATGRRNGGGGAGAGKLWARVFVGVHTAVVLIPIAVIAVWAFSSAWPWPSLTPTALTTRGAELVLSGSQGIGLGVVAGSIGIALASAFVATVAATLAARAICLHEWRGRSLLEFGVLLPFLIPSTVFAMGVQVAFLRIGLSGTVPGVVLSHSIIALPYATAIMTDVTRGAGTRLEQAARTLGAGWARTVWHVTLPSLAPGLVSSMSMGYILSFSQYFLTLLIGGGKVKTFATVLFPYLSGGDRTVAGAYGLAFILITLAVFLLFELLLRKVRPVEAQELYAG